MNKNQYPIKIYPYVPLTYGTGIPAKRGATRVAFPYPEGIKDKIYFDLFYIKNISRLNTLSCDEFYEVFMLRKSFSIGSKIVLPNLNSHFSATISKKGYESLGETPLEDLREEVCNHISRDLFLPKYWEFYKENLPSQPCKLEAEGRLDTLISSIGKKLEEFFEAKELESEDDYKKPDIYINFLTNLNLNQRVYPELNLSLPLSITSKQPFGGRLGYDISDPEDVKKVLEMYRLNFQFKFDVEEISKTIGLKEMAQKDAAKDSDPTNFPASNSALKLQPTEHNKQI